MGIALCEEVAHSPAAPCSLYHSIVIFGASKNYVSIFTAVFLTDTIIFYLLGSE